MDDQTRIQAALRLMESHRKASAAYYGRIREKKKEDGTYKGRGRPRKEPKEPDAVAPV